MTENARSRLEKLLEKTDPRYSGDSVPKAQMEVGTACAVEMIEAMDRLTLGVNDMANRSEIASVESGKVSRKLNQLTIWIVIAALVSTVAAGIQAWAAWYTIHNPHP
jgi:hypothetical protein